MNKLFVFSDIILWCKDGYESLESLSVQKCSPD